VKQTVPLKKQSKRARKAYHALQRADWNGVRPVTRVVPDKTAYDRRRQARDDRREARLDD